MEKDLLKGKTQAEKNLFLVTLWEEIQRLRERNKYLEEQVAFFQRQFFASKSEKTAKRLPAEENQLSFFNEVEIETEPKAEEPTLETIKSYQRKKKKAKAKDALSADVEHVKVLLPLKETTCPRCREEMHTVSENLVRSEIEFVPAKVRVLDYYEQVLECRACKGHSDPVFRKSKVPDALLPHSMASSSSVAELIHRKYALALPLYRQEQEWEDCGVRLSRQTMANWIAKTFALYLKPVVQHMQKALLQEELLHADETPVQVLKEPGRDNTAKSYMWVFTTGEKAKRQIRLFEYHPTRSGTVPAKFLQGFQGVLQTDAYAGYKQVEKVKQATCWVHLRRKFLDVPGKGGGKESTLCRQGITQINQLFKLEEKWKEMSAEEVLRLRKEKEAPIVDRFFAWAEKAVYCVTPKSKLGLALHYALANEKTFRTYLQEPEASLSNNIAENAIRPFVVGRKNWLFSGSPKGAKASAACYSIIETAKANGLTDRKYFNALLGKVQELGYPLREENLEELMPWSETMQELCK